MRNAIVTGLIVLLVGGGAAFYYLVIDKKIDDYKLEHQHGNAVGSIIGDNFVVLVDKVDIDKTEKDSITNAESTETIRRMRVTVVDPATGKQVLQKLIDGDGACAPAGGERLWCDFGGRLGVYNAKSLVQVADVQGAIVLAKLGTIVSVKEGLGYGNDKPRPVWRVDGARATFLLEGGKAAIYDAATGAVRRDELAPPALAPNGPIPAKAGRVRMPQSCGQRGIGIIEGDADCENMAVVGKLRIATSHDPAKRAQATDQAGKVVWTAAF